MDKWKYVVSKEHYLEGHHLKKGDIIRLETSPLEDIIKVKQLAFSKIRRHPRNIILYHLDSLNIAQYSEENIRLIYIVVHETFLLHFIIDIAMSIFIGLWPL